MQMKIVPLPIALMLCALAGHAADAQPKKFALDIARGSVPAAQRLMKVEKGDAVTLTIASDAVGELHLHGYRLATKVAPGEPAQISFTAYATGRYPLEWHAVGVAAKPGAHHGPPLSALEVRPK